MPESFNPSTDQVSTAISPDSGPPETRLTPTQELALQHLAAGSSICEAAERAGIGRRTLHRWIKEDPDFAAAYNAWRRELIDSGHARALAMTDRALAAIDKAIEKGNASVALQLVRGIGVLQQPRVGPEDPGYVQRRRAVTDARRETRLRKAEKSYEVTSAKPLQTPEEVDECIASLQEMKQHMIWLKEMSWHVYEHNRDLSEEERILRRVYDREPPADYPGEGWKSALPGRPGSKFPAPNNSEPPPAPAGEAGGAAEPSPSIDRTLSQNDPSPFDDEDDVD